jgi:hypothetical protein
MGIRFAACLVMLSLGACSTPSESPQPADAVPQAKETEAHDMPAGEVVPPKTDADMIASAMAAAPDAVSANATILGFDEKMQPRTLRAGTNGWTCMPDMPHTPGADPMCLDRNGMAWAEAWMAHKDPPPNQMGFGYMLMGGSDASNTDPFAVKPTEGAAWVDTGPHVMILNIGDRFAGYPTTPDNPKAPFVMFPNTPYAHLMLPVD